MDKIPLYVGLDYHQDSIQVCVLNQQGNVLLNRSVDNDAGKLQGLLEPLGSVRRVGIEACCGAADFGEELSERTGWPVQLGHAAYIARMKSSPDKSDFSDGRLIADLTRVGYLPQVWLAPLKVRELRQLVHHRQSLVDRNRSLKLQAGAILREQRVKIASPQGRWTLGWMACLKDNAELSEQGRWIVNDLLEDIAGMGRKIARVETRLRKATAGDAVVAKLMEQDGIGEVTAWVLRAYVGDFGRFTRAKQLSRYCGLSPTNRSSGNKTADAGLVRECNPILRRTIVQLAQRLIRSEGRWQRLAVQLQKRGKPKCLAVAAVGNRWLRCLHHVMKPAARGPAAMKPEAIGPSGVQSE